MCLSLNSLNTLQAAYALFGTTVIGVILVPVIQKITDRYTSYQHKPVNEIADSAKWGYASLTLMGIIKGMQSTGPFMIALVVAIIISIVSQHPAAPEGCRPSIVWNLWNLTYCNGNAKSCRNCSKY